VKIDFYSGSSGISGGSEITPRNNNRNFSNGSNLSLLKDPTSISDDGTKASGYLAGGERESGIIGRDKEIILEQNTIYLARITSLANSNDVSWIADWYEC
jgi:hypothetical protein